MDNGLHVPVTEVINNLYAKHKWADGYWTEETVLNAAKSLMSLIATNNQFAETYAFSKITDGRFTVPKDLIYLETVALTNKETVEDAIKCGCDISFIPMSEMTDTAKRVFYDKTPSSFANLNNVTYKINHNYGFSNVNSGVVCIFYNQMPLTDSGEIAIPDNESFKLALMYDVLETVAREMWMYDKLTEAKFKHISQERDWYVGQAGNAGKIPTPDGRAAFKNQNLNWPNSHFPEKNFHLNMFKSRFVNTKFS